MLKVLKFIPHAKYDCILENFTPPVPPLTNLGATTDDIATAGKLSIFSSVDDSISIFSDEIECSPCIKFLHLVL